MTIPSFKILEMDVIRRMDEKRPIYHNLPDTDMRLILGQNLRSLIEQAEDLEIDLCDALNHAIGGTKT